MQGRQIQRLCKVLSRPVSTRQCLFDPIAVNKSHTPPIFTSHQIRYLSTPQNSSLLAEEDTWLSKRMMNTRLKLGMAPRVKPYYRLRGLCLFQSVEKVNWIDFFRVFNMPDTFHSWFLVIELHMWMTSVRCSDEGKEGELIKQFSIEYMWEGAQKRAKKLESYAPSALRKGFDDLYEEFVAAFLMYDHGLLTSDVALADVLWYRFLQRNCDDPEKLELLVKYVRKQIHHLDGLSKEDFIDRINFTWLPLSEKTYL